MSFLSPASLLWLIPGLGAIVLLYILKMRRQPVRIPANFLWPQRTEEIRANAPWQKLRPSWLLLLQLLAMTLAVVAIARPQIRMNSPLGTTTVIVLDASASMQAKDVAPSRFEEGKKFVRNLLSAAKAGDRVALVKAGAEPAVVFPTTAEPRTMTARVNALEPTDAAGDMGEALRLAAALASATPGSRIIVVSDGNFAPIRDFNPGQAEVVYQRIAGEGENTAISSFGTAKSQGGLEIYVALKNYGQQVSLPRLVLTADGKPFQVLKPRVDPGKSWGKTFSAPAGSRILEAKLDEKDALAADDYAVSINDPSSSAKTLLVGPDDPFTERALALDPRVTLDRARFAPEDTSRYDVVVFNGVPATEVSARGRLYMGSIGPGAPVTDNGDERRVSWKGVEPTPILDSVDLTGVSVSSAQKVTPSDGATILASTQNSPALVASDRNGRSLYLSFAPLRSDFPIQVGFPIFFGNALDYLLGSSAKALAIAPGATFNVSSEEPVRVDRPGASSLSIEPVGGAARIRGLDRIGKYVVKGSGGETPVYVALRNDTESNLRGAARLQLGGTSVSATGDLARVGDFWKPLLVTFLLLLGFEWFVFVRKS